MKLDYQRPSRTGLPAQGTIQQKFQLDDIGPMLFKLFSEALKPTWRSKD
jgi:hypothetical protein